MAATDPKATFRARNEIMNSAIAKIEQAIESGVLLSGLTFIPDSGATDDDISAAAVALGRPVSSSHEALLRRWNGLNLDVVRIFGCGHTYTSGEIIDLGQRQIDGSANIVFGDDPSGFSYSEAQDGKVYSHDSDPISVEFVANNLESFFVDYLFGSDAELFGGKEWAAELIESGVI